MDLGPEELHALLEEQGNSCSFRLVDVREQDEFDFCKLPGAELIPLSRFVEEAPAKLGDHDQHIVVYCHHGMRSHNAAMWLRGQGYTNVSNLHGGIDAWADQIDPEMKRY